MVIDTVKIASEIDENLYTIKYIGWDAIENANVILQRLFIILQGQPGTIPMLDNQIMNFHKVMNRAGREHSYETYKNYVYATVGNYFKVKFSLLACMEEEVPEIVLDRIEYVKDDTRLICDFDALKMKIKTATVTRNFRYKNTPFSFKDNFLSLAGTMPVLESENDIRMEIQDFLFDYTNLQELLNNE